ncbi:MAG: hypothetical protein WBP45_08105 [Daejeonella sp.]
MLKLSLIITCTLIIMILCTSCITRKNKSEYTFSISKNKNLNDNSAYIISSFYEANTKKPIYAGGLFVNDSLYKIQPPTNISKLSLKPGKYRFQGYCIYCSRLTTKRILLAGGDTLKLTFYLDDMKPVLLIDK